MKAAPSTGDLSRAGLRFRRPFGAVTFASRKLAYASPDRRSLSQFLRSGSQRRRQSLEPLRITASCGSRILVELRRERVERDDDGGAPPLRARAQAIGAPECVFHAPCA